MKKIYSLMLAGSLIFGVSTIAKAQPPEPEISSPTVDAHSPRSAEDTLYTFLDVCSRDEPWSAAVFVEVQHPDIDELETLAADEAITMGRFQLLASDCHITPDPRNPDLVTATYNLGLYDYAMGYDFTQKDSIEMRRHLLPNGKEYWLIIPNHLKANLKPMPTEFPVSKTPGGISGYTAYLATMIAYPEEVLPGIYLGQSKRQLQQITLSLFQFTQDSNEQLDFTQQNFQEKLTPYLKNASVFTAPGDLPNTISYDVNPNIVGLSLADFPSPADVVAFYLGRDQKIDFRYGGLSPVGFMDGDVKVVTREEAKDLRWKP